LGLVEIMIAVTIALFLLTGIYTLFLNTKSTYNTQQGLSRIQENARYAIEKLSHDVRMAGYMGCGGANPQNAVNTLNNANDYAYDFSVPIQGFDGQGTSWSPNLPPALSGLTHPPIDGTDVITVRGADGGGIRIVSPMPQPSAELKVSTLNNSGIAIGDIVMLSDCTDAAIFQLTNVQSSDHLQHQTGTQTPGNATKNLGKSYQAGALVQAASTRSYFIANANSTSCSDGGCGLWELTGAGSEQELVRGVEDMQILYGVAPGAKETASSYVDASNVSDWSRVVSVRIALVLNSIDPTSPQSYTRDFQILAQSRSITSRRLHRVFTTTIALRNRLP